MKKLTALLFGIIICTSLFAQSTIQIEKCGYNRIVEKIRSKTPDFDLKRKELADFTRSWIANNPTNKNAAVITIPVVVHVLYDNSSMNISDAQIQSQLDVLNADYRKTNTDFSSTPAVFQAVAADSEIEFCLAAQDPDGIATNGVTRTSVNAGFDYYNDYYTASGHTPWDNSMYLNVWTGNLLDIGILGFATPPSGGGSWDGACVDYRVWGTTGAAGGQWPNDLGRTATHEIGHYFNLEHVWGFSGGCGNDDGVTDTPLQNGENYGCPTFPLTDVCTSGDGIMYCNYMDYVDDACMTLFTEGQKQRMLACLASSRSALAASNKCTAPGATAINSPALEKGISISPNPALNTISVAIDHSGSLNYAIEIYNFTGQLIMKQKLNGVLNSVDISSLTSGIYIVHLSDNNGKQLQLQKLVKE